ncbi:MAG: Cpe/LpqF family protein [Propionibacteriaceae bacterium]|nr:Cpe/LpqF family protein [Propionibacteriaceae bacterium]
MCSLLLVGLVGVTACSPATDAGTSENTTEAVTSNKGSEPAVTLSESAVGAQASWVISILNGSAPVEEAEITEHLADVMFEELSVDDFVEVFEQLRTDQPWTVAKVEETGDKAVVGLRGGSGTGLDMSLSLDPAGQINGLFFAPASDRTPSTSWEQVENAVQALPASTTLSVTQGTDSAETVLMVGDGAAQPIGSTFKLYVLGAVVEAVEAGVLDWETSLTLTEDLRSLPSGKLQEEPAGTEVSVREAAELMISISDNTATDMLMDAVGRDAVENEQVKLGHHDPALNIPFLTTRELFQLGWGEGTKVGARWASATVDERREILEQLPDGTVDVAPEAVTDPVWQHGLDWFATGADLRAAHLGLQKLATTEAGAPVREILAINPGVGLSIGDEWAYVGFKGGSSVGELAGSWYVERADGESFTLSIQAASQDPADLTDTQAYFGQIEDALVLLADH